MDSALLQLKMFLDSVEYPASSFDLRNHALEKHAADDILTILGQFEPEEIFADAKHVVDRYEELRRVALETYSSIENELFLDQDPFLAMLARLKSERRQAVMGP